jgi:TusA-related sulfurtransferase
MSGKLELHMSNCPSAVRGAVTEVVDVDDGVQITVTARDERAQQEIRQRAQDHGAASWDPERGSVEHTGTGTGSGRYGFCPGVLEQTTVDEELLPNGARITVRADQPAQVRKLQRITRERLRWLRKRQAPSS